MKHALLIKPDKAGSLYNDFKCTHGNAPDYLKDLIVLSQPQTGLHTSNRANCVVPLPFPKYCKVSNAFRYSAPTVWNNLPPIRSATSLTNFKSSLKAHYFNLMRMCD